MVEHIVQILEWLQQFLWVSEYLGIYGICPFVLMQVSHKVQKSFQLFVFRVSGSALFTLASLTSKRRMMFGILLSVNISYLVFPRQKLSFDICSYQIA